MGYDIGPKIGVDGEAEFRAAIKNLNTSLKTLGTEMGAVTSQFGKNQQSEEALTAKNKVLNREIESQKDKLSKLKEGLAQSAAKYGENDEKTQKWQQAVNKAQETLNKQKNELDDNEKSLENLKNGVDDAAVSEQDATKKTSVFGEVLKANLTSTAIKSGIQCIKDGFSKIAQGIQSATGKLKEAITESVEYGDNVDKMSQKLGMSTDAYQKWSYVIERAGTSIDSMKGGMKKLATAAQSNAKEFQKLGISQKDVKSLNQEDLFEKTIEGLAGMKAGTERTALASKLLGKSAVELGPLLNEGTGEIKKQMDIAERYGLVMSQKAVKGSAEFKDSLTTLQGVITGLRNKFIGEFFPSLTMVTDGLSKVFSGVDVSGGLKSIDTGIKQFSDKLNQVLPHVQEVGGKILSTLGQAIATNLPTILSSATKIASTITTGIINAAPMLISSGAQIVVALINGISQNLPKIIPAVVSAVKQIGSTIRQHSGEIGKALDASIPGATKSIEKLKTAFFVLAPAIILAKTAVGGFKVASAISGIVDMLRKALEKQTIATEGQTLAQTGLNGVMAANPFGVVAVAIMGVATALVALYNHNAKFRTQVDKLKEDLEKFASNIGKDAKTLFAKTIPNAGKAMVKWFERLPELLVNIGTNMIKGLWNGIKSSIKWLNDKVSDFCSGIIKNVKNAFGIHSPSTVFAEIGRFLMLGLNNGVRDSKALVYNTIEKIDNAIIKEQARLETALKDPKITGATKTNLQNQLDALNAFKTNYEAALKEVQDAQGSMADKLKSYGDLFTKTTQDNADVFSLTDLQSQIDQITQYSNALEALKQRGTPDSLVSKVVAMDVDDAIKYMGKLSEMDDTTFKQYTDLWTEKQQLSESASKSFYADKLAEVQNSFVKKIPDALSGLKTQMKTLGQKTATSLADGFKSQQAAIETAIRTTIQSAMQSVSASVNVASRVTAVQQPAGTAAINNQTSTIGTMLSGAVNAIMQSNQSRQSGDLVMPVYLGEERVAKAILPAFRSASKASPEVVSDKL